MTQSVAPVATPTMIPRNALTSSSIVYPASGRLPRSFRDEATWINLLRPFEPEITHLRVGIVAKCKHPLDRASAVHHIDSTQRYRVLAERERACPDASRACSRSISASADSNWGSTSRKRASFRSFFACSYRPSNDSTRASRRLSWKSAIGSVDGRRLRGDVGFNVAGWPRREAAGPPVAGRNSHRREVLRIGPAGPVNRPDGERGLDRRSRCSPFGSPGDGVAKFASVRVPSREVRQWALPETKPWTGGWYRVRTCDPCRVKAVLYR